MITKALHRFKEWLLDCYYWWDFKAWHKAAMNTRIMGYVSKNGRCAECGTYIGRDCGIEVGSGDVAEIFPVCSIGCLKTYGAKKGTTYTP